MGFDINGFKNAFFAEMKRASNLESADGKINTDLETKEANKIQSTFKAELSKVTDPIGDAFVKSADNKQGEFDNISIEDLTALLDDPELNIGRVNQLIEEKPVETIAQIRNIGEVEQPEELQEMAEISDADTEGVKFHTDLAILSGRDKEIGKNTQVSEEGIDTLESPDLFDLFMDAMYDIYAA